MTRRNRAPVAAGRPATADPRRNRTVRATDAEWGHICELAAAAGMSPSRYVIARAVEPDTVGPALRTAQDLASELVTRLKAARRQG